MGELEIILRATTSSKRITFISQGEHTIATSNDPYIDDVEMMSLWDDVKVMSPSMGTLSSGLG